MSIFEVSEIRVLVYQKLYRYVVGANLRTIDFMICSCMSLIPPETV